MGNVADIRVIKTRKLNDEFRKSLRATPLGQVVLTQGVSALAPSTLKSIIEGIESFDSFSEDNDPWGEHDFGAINVVDKTGRTQRVLFKIDYYDKNLQFGSEDPSNPKVTERVMTVMLSHEY